MVFREENNSRRPLQGFVLVLAALLAAALVFAGCSSDSDDDSGSDPVPPTGWTLAAGDFGTTPIQKIVFGSNKFVATGNASSAWYSADGIAWTASADKAGLSIPGEDGAVTTNNFSGLTFGNGKFLAAGGSSGNKIWAYSTDGDKWTATGDATPDTGSNFNAKGLAFGKGYFLVGGSGGQIAYTDDPSKTDSWKTLDAAATTFNAEGKNGFVNGIAFGDNKFVAAGSNYGHAAYSDDGIKWTGITQTEEIFGGWINGVAYGGGKFVAVGDGGKAAWASASTVTDWTAVVDIKLAGNILGAAYGNGYFVVVDNAGAASYSSDGIIWTAIADTKFGSDAINGVTFGNGKFVIVGANGKAAYAAAN
jgi:hypothetical protein